MAASSRKHPLDKAESIYYSYIHTHMQKNISITQVFQIHLEALEILKHSEYYSRVLYACLGVVENIHLIKVDLLLLRMHIHRKKASPILQVFEILSQRTLFKY